jgi:hypothetical protein
MNTYSREYLKGLKKEEDMRQYNDKLNEVVSTISKGIILTATRGSTELILKTEIIPPQIGSCRGSSRGHNTVVVYDIEMIHKVIDKLKNQFFDSHIEYVESKDLRGNILDSAICIKWD